MLTFMKPKTVATVMATFRTAITDLETIAEANMAQSVALNEQKTALEDRLEDIDLEIHQARGTAARLHTLVFGPEFDVDSDDATDA